MGADIVYTYDVYWQDSKIKWASRWDAYLRMPGGKVGGAGPRQAGAKATGGGCGTWVGGTLLSARRGEELGTQREGLPSRRHASNAPFPCPLSPHSPLCLSLLASSCRVAAGALVLHREQPAGGAGHGHHRGHDPGERRAAGSRAAAGRGRRDRRDRQAAGAAGRQRWWQQGSGCGRETRGTAGSIP